MKKEININSCEQFIYRNARSIDLYRWNYHFHNGSKEDVIKALSFYQNEDGGFGNGLELDCLNPNSSPTQTNTAVNILKEIGFFDSTHPMIKNILRYLGNTPDFDGHLYGSTIASNNDYPHAPWWQHPTDAFVYNPTSSLIGFILLHQPHNTELYQTAIKVLNEAYDYFVNNYQSLSKHTTRNFLDLYQYLEMSSQNLVDMKQFLTLLTISINNAIDKDTSVWATEYICKPSFFIDSLNSHFYSANSDICQYECDFMAETQNQDGSWDVTWNWNSYPEYWPIVKKHWKSDIIITNVLFYKTIRN